MTRRLFAIALAVYAAAWFLLLSMGSTLANDGSLHLDKPTPIENWQVLAGIGLPLVLSVIMQSNWSRPTQSAVSVGASLLVSLVAVLLQDESIIIPDIIIRGLEVFAFTIVSYYGVYKPTKIAPTLEAKTNVTEAGRRAARAKLAALPD